MRETERGAWPHPFNLGVPLIETQYGFLMETLQEFARMFCEKQGRGCRQALCLAKTITKLFTKQTGKAAMDCIRYPYH